MRLIGRDERELQSALEWVRYELLQGGDGTILWFLPDYGAFVFPGDARQNTVIRSETDLERYFHPSVTPANRENLEKLIAGDGPLAVEGTRHELYNLLGLEPAGCG